MKPLPASRRDALSRMHPNDMVRVYTYQHPDAWTAALRTGYLTGEGAPVDPDWDDIVGTAYGWMRRAMSERIPSHTGDLPVWCWLKRTNPRRHRWTKGRVRITALVPRGRMLLSDYEAWHLPLNRGAITLSEDDERQWDPHHGTPKVQETWHRVLDIVDRPADVAAWLGQPAVVQACVDRIRLSEITSVRHPEQTSHGPQHM